MTPLIFDLTYDASATLNPASMIDTTGASIRNGQLVTYRIRNSAVSAISVTLLVTVSGAAPCVFDIPASSPYVNPVVIQASEYAEVQAIFNAKERVFSLLNVSKDTAAPREYLSITDKTLTDNVATKIATITVAAGKFVGGEILATVHADDTTDFQAITDHVTFAAVNKAGTVTAVIQATPSTSATAASTGTLTTAWTVATTGNNVEIWVQANTSLSGGSMTVKGAFQLRLNTDNVAATITP